MTYEEWQLAVDDLSDEMASLDRQRRAEQRGVCYMFISLLNTGAMATLAVMPGLGELGWVALTWVIMTVLLAVTFIDHGPRKYSHDIEALRLKRGKLRRRMPTDLPPKGLLL